MTARKLAATASVGVLLACGMARTAAWDQQQIPPDASTEQEAYQAAHNEKEAQNKIKLLDDFLAKYPDSALRPEIYRDYYLAYFSLEDYQQVIPYADKLGAMGDKVDLDSRILALVSREVAYFASCADPGLQTLEAYTKARDAGRQGLELLGQWQKPENMTDEQFDAEKKSFEIILTGVTTMAESGLAGRQVSCLAPKTPQAPDDRRIFDRMIKDIQEQQRQSPRVK